MCTSIAMKTNDFYFGRTMDLEYELDGSIVITPRNFPIIFRKAAPLKRHYAIMGMAVVTIAPVILLSILFSRQLKQSIAASGVKG